MSYFELARFQIYQWNLNEHVTRRVIRRVLRLRAYERHIARSKSYLTPDHMRRRRCSVEDNF